MASTTLYPPNNFVYVLYLKALVSICDAIWMIAYHLLAVVHVLRITFTAVLPRPMSAKPSFRLRGWLNGNR